MAEDKIAMVLNKVIDATDQRKLKWSVVDPNSFKTIVADKTIILKSSVLGAYRFLVFDKEIQLGGINSVADKDGSVIQIRLKRLFKTVFNQVYRVDESFDEIINSLS